MPGLSAGSAPVLEALDRGAALAVSISGGKDSQAMLELLSAEREALGWQGRFLAIHADLGAAEWPQTPGHVRFMADRAHVGLTVVRRPQGDLLDEIKARVVTLGGSAPPWPSSTERYCTSDQKRGQIDKVIRSSPWPSSTQRYCTADQKRDQLLKEQRKLGDLVVTAIGMRAQEGCQVCRKAAKGNRVPLPHAHRSKRADRQVVSIAKRLTAKRLASMSVDEALRAWDLNRGERLVLEWLPIHEWEEAADVWPSLGYSLADVNRRRALYKTGAEAEAFDGWLAHPAYVIGNERLSCSICILACKGDLENGARHNPALFREYLQIEQATGFTFRVDQALADLAVAHELAPDLVGPSKKMQQKGLFG
jgi:3'-phosphoadenosine 5'-phosphosulfate sulfotransferase (PAPS reductase)/FAD synthetase